MNISLALSAFPSIPTSFLRINISSMFPNNYKLHF
jgi:hypothetical protein